MARELYFIHDGKRHECGTVLLFRNEHSQATYEVVFLCCNPEFDSFTYQGKNGGPWYGINSRIFYEKLAEVKDEICEPIRDDFLKSSGNYNHKRTIKEELLDDDLLIAWIWYIFIMVAAVIFHWRIVIWAIATYIFNDYRNTKLRK